MDDLKITLLDYWDMLNSHDWYYSFSDDARVYNRGEHNFSRLASIAGYYLRKGDGKYQDMFKGFKDHMFSGEPWRTEQAPMPIRPEEK